MVKLTRLHKETYNNKNTTPNRPQTSTQLDQYVWSYIDKEIVQPKKLLQSEKWVYLLVICFDKFDGGNYRYYQNNRYNPNFDIAQDDKYMHTVDWKLKETDCLFSAEKFWVLAGNTKASHITISSPLADRNITPEQYAGLLYDGFGCFLTCNFKKVKKAELDAIKFGLSKEIINSFPFPVPAPKQGYVNDKNNQNIFLEDTAGTP